MKKENQVNKLYSFPFETKAFVIRYPLNLIRQGIFLLQAVPPLN